MNNMKKVIKVGEKENVFLREDFFIRRRLRRRRLGLRLPPSSLSSMSTISSVAVVVVTVMAVAVAAAFVYMLTAHIFFYFLCSRHFYFVYMVEFLNRQTFFGIYIFACRTGALGGCSR